MVSSNDSANHPETDSGDAQDAPSAVTRRRFLFLLLAVVAVAAPVPFLLFRRKRRRDPVQVRVTGPIQPDSYLDFELPQNKLVNTNHIYVRPLGSTQTQVCVDFVFLGPEDPVRRLVLTAEMRDTGKKLIGRAAATCTDGRALARLPEKSGGLGASALPMNYQALTLPVPLPPDNDYTLSLKFSEF